MKENKIHTKSHNGTVCRYTLKPPTLLRSSSFMCSVFWAFLGKFFPTESQCRKLALEVDTGGVGKELAK